MDESFERAFALLDQLASDTTELKESEKARTERLDTALGEVEAVVGRMREANESREAEGRRLAREVESLRDGIPRAIEKERERDEERLKELVAEVRSLKTLVGNRMGGGGSVGGAQQQQSQLGFRGNSSQTAPAQQQQQQQPLTNGSAPTAPVEPQQNGSSSPASASNGIDNTTSNPSQSSSPFPDRAQANSSPFERSGAGARGGGAGAGKAAIPSWQLAAKKRSEEQQQQQAQKSSAGEGGGEVSGATTAATGTGARVEDARE